MFLYLLSPLNIPVFLLTTSCVSLMKILLTSMPNWMLIRKFLMRRWMNSARELYLPMHFCLMIKGIRFCWTLKIRIKSEKSLLKRTLISFTFARISLNNILISTKRQRATLTLFPRVWFQLLARCFSHRIICSSIRSIMTWFAVTVRVFVISTTTRCGCVCFAGKYDIT